MEIQSYLSAVNTSSFSPAYLSQHLSHLPTQPWSTMIIPSSFQFTNQNQYLRDYFYLLISITVPLELLYLTVYSRIKNHHKTFHSLTLVTLAALWIFPYIAPLKCGASKMVRNCAISSLTMKLLDVWARRNALPVYKAEKTGKVLPDWMMSLLLVTEMRYESFTPNNIKLPQGRKVNSEPWSFAIHLAILNAFHFFPYQYPTIIAFRFIFSIYLSMTAIHMIFRYKNSPALFGPIYQAESLAGFWSETWHNTYASACLSITYFPIKNALSNLGTPKLLSRAMGMIGAFSLMAVFHVYVSLPVLDPVALIKVGLFFFLNGVATVAEAAVWGKKKHWLKAVSAWTFEILLATWTAESLIGFFENLNCSSE